MTIDPSLSCEKEARRDDVRQAALYGLDFLEVSDNQRSLEVFFLGKAPQKITPQNVQISGGTRITGITATAVQLFHQTDPSLDDYMIVTVNQPGDFSPYTLGLVNVDEQGRPTNNPMGGFDPAYSTITFSFKANCPSDLDCKQVHSCPPAARTIPDINYLAKDYASFRQLILDRLALLIPDWQEAHAADIGIMLVELLAYIGDYLSYYQDAVATEAYLGTARQRISVRRHARLVDYFMHEGCNARAWITISASEDAVLDPANTYFTTALPGNPGQHVFQPNDIAKATPSSYLVFEPLVPDNSPIQLYAAHSELHFYTWGDSECCLAKGATSATLIDSWTSDDQKTRAVHLEVGDVLIFEEVLGPKTGNPADADPTHRQAVQLTEVTPSVDQLYNQPVVVIEWCSQDALNFPLCISARRPAPDCSVLGNVSVARGNVLLVDHGATTSESLGTVSTQTSTAACPTCCDPPQITLTPCKFRPKLSQQPLTYRQPLAACACATPILTQDPREALPGITTLTGTETTPRGVVITYWTPLYDLLESGPSDTVFVVEIDNNGYAHLRFGDGELGMMPDAGTTFDVKYRVGNGTAGNVGAEAICCLVYRQLNEGGGTLVPRNPLAAAGGIDPETIDEVKFLAPYGFQDVIERAITADDYSSLASDNARRLEERPAKLCGVPFQQLQSAKAALRWNGSWLEALVAVDPQGTESASVALLGQMRRYLKPYVRIGHDLKVVGATYVPLYLSLDVCVLPQYLRANVEATLEQLFGTGTLPNGQPAFFNPDNLTFGQGVYVSRIVAAAQGVAGVQSVRVARLQRYQFDVRAGQAVLLRQPVPATGVLSLGPFEIAQLDNNPNFPENGRLILNVRGGR